MLNNLLQVIFFIPLFNVNAGNILAVFLTPSISPLPTFTNLIQELAERGYEITLVTATAFATEETKNNIITVDLHDKLYNIWLKYNNMIVADLNRDVVSEVTLTLDMTNDFFEELLKTVEFKKLIDEKRSYFDLLLFEASVTPLLTLSHIFKAPVILLSSFGVVSDNYEIVGAPTHPFLYPSIFQRRVYNLTTWEKLSEISTQIRLKLKMLSNEKRVEVIVKKQLGLDFTSMDALRRNVLALFINSNPIWAGNRPVSPNVVFMGELHPNNIEELPEDLQSFLERSKRGVIYISFGSNIRPSQLPPMKVLKMLNALSEIHYDVVLKWDSNKMPGAPKNVKVYKWLPQSSLLVHPKIKLFITHGGVQSTFDGINAGVPLIGIPVHADQWYNTEKYKHFHIGVQMDLASLTEDSLIDAINLVINDQSYRTSIAELRVLMYEQFGSSLERAIWWVEQAMRPYGIRYLRSPAANMSWSEYLELDFVFSLLSILFVLIIALTIITKLLIRYISMTIDDVKKKVG